jgi:hypothetical protein
VSKKNYLLIIILFVGAFLLLSCKNINEDLKEKLVNLPNDYNHVLTKNLEDELYLSYLYFEELTSKTNLTYGLARDRYTNSGLSSIASTGYAILSYVIGVDNGYISYSEGYEKALKTLQTIKTLNKVEGFMYHFYSMNSGYPSSGSEVSIIDTSLFLVGALTAAEYFKDEVLALFLEIYDAVNWNFYFDTSVNEYYMGYNPSTKKFSGHWDRYSEQHIIYLLAAGSRTYPSGSLPYSTILNEIVKHKGQFNQETEEFYLTWGGQLFINQYSNSYIYFDNIVDKKGINWFLNSVTATQANYLYCQSLNTTYKTFQNNVFGVSASDGPKGYKAYGSRPCETLKNEIDGTVSPYSIIGSINYAPELVISLTDYLASNPKIFQKYGFISAYNLGLFDDVSETIDGINYEWYSADFIGIDKGNEMVNLQNYKNALVWRTFMSNKEVQEGLYIMGFKKI